MTAKELIRALMEAPDLNVEVGIAFEDGWTSIKNLEDPTFQRSVIKLEPEDALYDRPRAGMEENDE